MTRFELRFVPLDSLRGSPPGIEFRAPYEEGWRAVLESVGLPEPIIVNARTGRVLSAPHVIAALHDLKAAKAEPPRGIDADSGVWRVPAVLIHSTTLDEDRIAMILAGGVDHTLKPGVKDASAIKLLLRLTQEGIDRRDMRAVMAAGVSLENLGAILDELSYEPSPADQPRPSHAIEADDWGIPMLDPARQPVALTAPMIKYGSIARFGFKEGTYHFYARDKVFTKLIKTPLAVPDAGCTVAVEPNFSTGATMPAALALYRIYQKRVISTTWQRAGMDVWVDLNVDRRFLELNLLGVPAGWRAYVNRAYTRDLKHLSEAYELACQRAGSRDILYVVYGAGEKAQALCAQHGWVWYPEDADVKRGRFHGQANLRPTT